MLMIIRKFPEWKRVGKNTADIEIVREGDEQDIDFFLQDDEVFQAIESILVFDNKWNLLEIVVVEGDLHSHAPANI